MNTLFLAAVIGWVMVAASLVILLRHDHLKLAMGDVMGQRGVFFVFAFLTLIIGVLMVVSHNVWVMEWPVIVTLLGWFVVVSALLRLFFPDAVMRMGQSFLNHPHGMQIAGIIYLIIGLFLLYHVYYLHA